MNPIYKRGAVYHFATTRGGRRIRVSLGVRDAKSARRLADRIGYAFCEGPASEIWPTLALVLPPASYKSLTHGFEFPAPAALADLEQKFLDHIERRVKLGELAESSRKLYADTTIRFMDRMIELGIKTVEEITTEVLDTYLVRRVEDMKAHRKTGRGIVTEKTVLAMVFNFAREEGLIPKSPLTKRYRPDVDPGGSEPFTTEEMERLLVAVDDKTLLLPFLLLKNTGLRGGDASDLTWDAVDLTTRTIKVRTRKRKKWVSIPVASELAEELDKVYAERKPEPGDRVLQGWTRARLYKEMIALGIRAAVANANPHRFRDTLVSTLLSKGASLFDVSRLIGDSPEVVDKYYASCTQEQQDRVRGLLEK